jgi:hypothetical protein
VQADLYASCLLMPRKLVLQAWRDRFGNDDPRMLRRKDRIVVPCDVDEEIAAVVRSFDQTRDDEVLEHFARPFAKQFMVSPPPCVSGLRGSAFSTAKFRGSGPCSSAPDFF